MARLSEPTAPRTCLRVILISALAVLAGCSGLGEDADGDARFDRHRIIDSLMQIERNTGTDPLGPVHQARPAIFHRFFGPHVGGL